MAKYGECISGRPSYQTHRQTYYPTALNRGAEAEAGGGGGGACSSSDGGNNSRSDGGCGSGGSRSGSSSGGGVGGGGQGARLGQSGGGTTGTISQRDPVYPRSLAEEVLWRQRRFAWWGTTYLVDPVSIPPQLPPNPAQLKAQQILQQLRNKDVSLDVIYNVFIYTGRGAHRHFSSIVVIIIIII